MPPANAVVTLCGHGRSSEFTDSGGCAERFMMPTEDYPGPSRSHPEKEDKNDPPRPAGVDPVKPPMPETEEPPLQDEGEEE